MERINLVELLKDCIGMELDCAIFNNARLEKINFEEDEEYPIRINTLDGFTISLTQYGTYIDAPEAKCVIFPKGKTSWGGFQRPFKDGDIVFYSDTIAIFKEWGDETLFRAHAYTYLGYEEYLCKEKPVFGKGIRKEVRFATEEEKAKLFKAIKENGYKWNSETKTLERLPKFKVGDKVRVKNGVSEPRIIDEVFDTFYSLQMFGKIDFTDQDRWELVPNKFDITTLVPFESKVLVRDDKLQKWSPAIWGFYDSDSQDYQYKLIGVIARYCIPYEGNEHLLGTTNDCDKFYRTWEKTGD